MLTIADFTLTELLYDNGGTRVHRAVRNSDGKPVTLKILGEERQQAEGFAGYQREYEITRALDGIEDVITVYDLIDIQNSVMIVGEDIGACSLDIILATEKLDLETGLKLACRLARALGKIHQHKVIHKDFNPANLIWNRDTDALRIIDFGIASQLNREQQEFENPNQLEGTLAYISPEQTGRVNRKLDYRTDLYSLGVCLYQLFTGRLPFAFREGIELVHAHIALAPIPPHQLLPEIPLVLSQIILRLMEKMADDRYQSAWGVQHDLERCLNQWQERSCITLFPLAENDASFGFHIPQKLYGREREVESIIDAFERVSQGNSELLLVSGFSGIGKSSLVHEVHQPLTEKRGYFASGKFDQYQRDMPFYAWSLALEDFCSLLLKEDEASLAQWRTHILSAVGTIGKVLTSIMPSIELIIGEQPETEPLSGEQALNRLNYVFGKFIGAVSSKDHPLVIFIDDWQWADAGSLSLLKSLMASREHQYLLLIGAYRDNEVDSLHPFSTAIDELRKAQTRIATISLGNLAQEDVHALISDTLEDAPGLESVSRQLFDKTQGNAFFLVQLLNDLYEKSVITFDRKSQHWIWQQSEIESIKIADNVVSLMTEKISSLPKDTQQALTHAACIGDRFDLATLSRILGKAAHHTADDLEASLQEGVLIPIGLNYRFARQKNNTGNVHYHFIHDRVRQAAYGMLAPDTAARIHFQIAQTWLTNNGGGEPEHNIFDIANQYNAGRPIICHDLQKNELLAINLQAGKRAKHATDYATALLYLQTALELRSPDCWQENPGQISELLLLAAEAAFLCKDFSSMESWLEEYLGLVTAPLARISAFKIRLQAYVAQNRLSEAVDVALHALQLLGIKLPKKPSSMQVMTGLLHTKLVLRGKSFAELKSLPKMTDPVKLAGMELLGLTIPPAYWTSQELVALTVFQMVRESVLHGYSPNAGYGFSWWGITESAMLGNIETGYNFGEFAIDLANKFKLNLQQPLFFAAWIIRKFKHPLKEMLPVFEQSYSVALEKGDFEYASYARNNHIQTQFHTGRNLHDLLAEMEQAHRDLERFQIGSSLYWHDMCWQTALNFVNYPSPVHVLAGPAYDEAVSLPQHLKVNDASSLFLLYSAKLMLSFFHNDTDNARAYAHTARTYLKGGVGMHAFALFHFYESLVLLADSENDSFLDRKRRLRKVANNQKQLLKWAKHAPMNHLHHWNLVEAECLRISRQPDQALRYYERAIDLARDNGFIHEEALAQELACRFHLQLKQERLASYSLRQSIQLYERWGANGKLAQLRAAYPALLLTAGQTTEQRRTTSTTPGKATYRSHGSAHGVEAFDFSAITQASQAISGEIVAEKLVTTLLKIVIAHSGAQKALLVLKHGDELRIEALGIAGESIAVSVQAQPIDSSSDAPLPRTMIHFVARTAKSVVIDDARRASQFSQDPYVLREKPLSVLCQPIVQQGKLMGILYLENNLTSGAFTNDRLELLRLLSSQAAISIENASLYRVLEQKVEERTQKLQASLITQERLNSELQLSSQELENAYAQLRDANQLLQQRADTDGLTGLANRRYFNERLAYELERCARDQQTLTLLLCDLDNFKRYNDTYGHVEGDECLRMTATTMKSVFGRTTDLVARYGGEEFVILLPATDAGQAEKLGNQMRQALESLAIPHSGNGQHGVVTLSIGCYALTPTPGMEQQTVIEQADKALYQAKREGRNRLAVLPQG